MPLAPEGQTGTAQPEQSPLLWIILTAGFALAWLVTLAVWWRGRGQYRVQAEPEPEAPHASHSARTALQQLQTACQQNDARAARKALLAWASGSDQTTASLELLAQNAPDILQNEIVLLDQIVYGNLSQTWQGQPLWEAVQAYLKRTPGKKNRKPDFELEPLHRVS